MLWVKLKLRNYSMLHVLILYSLFTTTCGLISVLLAKQSILPFCIWYIFTAVIWFILVVYAIILSTKLLQLKHMINRINNLRKWSLRSSYYTERRYLSNERFFIRICKKWICDSNDRLADYCYDWCLVYPE